MKKIVDEKSIQIYQEDEHSKLMLILPRTTIHKDSEMTATLNDGRRVWFDAEKNKWILPHRVSKGEVTL